MMDEQIGYEDLILEMQESEADDCANCQYKGIGRCQNQCMEIVSKYWNGKELSRK